MYVRCGGRDENVVGSGLSLSSFVVHGDKRRGDGDWGRREDGTGEKGIIRHPMYVCASAAAVDGCGQII